MSCVGLVAEFNPFHEGHAYLIEKVREELAPDVIISAMSGNFTQRGAFAYFDKWQRAADAVKGGVDIVAEMPTAYAVSSAENFASCGVRLLSAMGADTLAFGSETGDARALRKSARFLLSHEDELKPSISANIKEGMSYPKARAKACADIFADESLAPVGPNDILAHEYIKATIRNELEFRFFAVKRNGEGHNESASKIRESIRRESPEVYDLAEDRLFRMIAAKVLASDSAELERIASSGEGLGNRLVKLIRRATGFEELVSLVGSKAYTETRIRRLLIQTLLGITDDMLYSGPDYVRILAISAKGAAYLKDLKKSGEMDLPVISNINKDVEYSGISASGKNKLKLDIYASDVYNLILDRDLYKMSDYLRNPSVF